MEQNPGDNNSMINIKATGLTVEVDYPDVTTTEGEDRDEILRQAVERERQIVRITPGMLRTLHGEMAREVRS